MNKIKLKKNEEKRLLFGHQWIFSNEIDKIIGAPTEGEVVEILRFDEKLLGYGFFNSHSLISVRFLSNEEIEVDKMFFIDRIKKAFLIREKIFNSSNVYRLIYGESDFLPGLIIDRFDSTFVLQTFSVGMDLRIKIIAEALQDIFPVKCILERNSSATRKLENLEERVSVLFGEVKNEVVKIEGVNYKINFIESQKTGFFLDQRLNRVRVGRYAENAKVLDCFCNEGGFGISALIGGARNVDFVDISNHAIEQAKINVELNNLTNCNFFAEDVFEFFKNCKTKYDLIILDPPSFAKNKKSIATALKGYQQLHQLALNLIEENGILITATCSHHISEKDFFETLNRASNKQNRKIKLLESFGASPDHPILPSMPETNYLKCGFFLVN